MDCTVDMKLRVDLVLQRNWNLFSVNVAMAGTGLYQLSRKIRSVTKPATICTAQIMSVK